MKKRVTVDLDDQEYKELLLLKKKLDRPLAWIGRKAITEFLAKNTFNHDEKNISNIEDKV